MLAGLLAGLSVGNIRAERVPAVPQTPALR
jgi:hypothetical protein